MDTKSFLIGYFYAALQLHKNDVDNSVETNYHLYQIKLHTVRGGKLTVGINRGIAPLVGNTAYAFTNIEGSLFDIVKQWTTPEIWEHVELTHEIYCGETRVNIKDLVWIIDVFGGIDIEKMK